MTLKNSQEKSGKVMYSLLCSPFNIRCRTEQQNRGYCNFGGFENIIQISNSH